jgi:hypothetical protein
LLVTAISSAIDTGAGRRLHSVCDFGSGISDEIGLWTADATA